MSTNDKADTSTTVPIEHDMNPLQEDHAKILGLLDGLGDDESEFSEDESISISKLLETPLYGNQSFIKEKEQNIKEPSQEHQIIIESIQEQGDLINESNHEQQDNINDNSIISKSSHLSPQLDSDNKSFISESVESIHSGDKKPTSSYNTSFISEDQDTHSISPQKSLNSSHSLNSQPSSQMNSISFSNSSSLKKPNPILPRPDTLSYSQEFLSVDDESSQQSNIISPQNVMNSFSVNSNVSSMVDIHIEEILEGIDLKNESIGNENKDKENNVQTTHHNESEPINPIDDYKFKDQDLIIEFNQPKEPIPIDQPKEFIHQVTEDINFQSQEIYKSNDFLNTPDPIDYNDTPESIQHEKEESFIKDNDISKKKDIDIKETIDLTEEYLSSGFDENSKIYDDSPSIKESSNHESIQIGQSNDEYKQSDDYEDTNDEQESTKKVTFDEFIANLNIKSFENKSDSIQETMVKQNSQPTTININDLNNKQSINQSIETKDDIHETKTSPLEQELEESSIIYNNFKNDIEYYSAQESSFQYPSGSDKTNTTINSEPLANIDISYDSSILSNKSEPSELLSEYNKSLDKSTKPVKDSKTKAKTSASTSSKNIKTTVKTPVQKPKTEKNEKEKEKKIPIEPKKEKIITATTSKRSYLPISAKKQTPISRISSPFAGKPNTTTEESPITPIKNETNELLKQQIDQLQNELNILTKSNRDLITKIGSKDDKSLLKKLDEQEYLIKGFQTENEALFSRVKKLEKNDEWKLKLQKADLRYHNLTIEMESFKERHDAIVLKLEGEKNALIQSLKSKMGSENGMIESKEMDSSIKSNNVSSIKKLQALNDVQQKKIETFNKEIEDYKKEIGRLTNVSNTDCMKCQTFITQISTLKSRIKDYEIESNTPQFIMINGTLMNNETIQSHINALESQISKKSQIHNKEINQLKQDIIDIESNHNTQIKEIEKQSQSKPRSELTALLQHNLELEKIVSEQDEYISKTRHEQEQIKSQYNQRINELELVVTEYRTTMDELKQKIQHSTFMKEEFKYNDRINELETELTVSKMQQSKLKNQLEVSESTRKAIHENTIIILKQAQEESSKIALHQHECALNILRVQTSSHSTHIFEIETRRLLDHIKECDGENKRLNIRINELERELKRNVPFDNTNELFDEIKRLRECNIRLEEQLNSFKENRVPDTNHQTLVSKLKSLEERYFNRNHDEMNGNVEKIELKYRGLIEMKNREILGFKVQVDELIHEMIEYQNLVITK